MDLSTSKQRGKESNKEDCDSLTALACSCLMSLVIARGDTGNILSAIAAMLMSPTTLTTQEVKVGMAKNPFIWWCVADNVCISMLSAILLYVLKKRHWETFHPKTFLC